MKLNSPCFNCPDRYIGCHSKCEKYISYRKKLDELNAQYRKELYMENRMTDYELKQRQKISRKKQKIK